jgi:hypothetical protein
MMSSFRWVLAASMGGWFAAGCGTLTIPRIAVQGTTITIPVPDGFGSGFGRALNQQLTVTTTDPGSLNVPYVQGSDLDDPQRGEILFALRTSPSPISSLVSYLPVRYVTRVHVDEASAAGMPAPGIPFEGTNPGTGQVLALVDVPLATPPGTYYVLAERWKRSTVSPYTSFFKDTPTISSPPVNWVAWGGKDAFYGLPSPELGMPIRVVESPYATSLFNDAVEGYDRWWGSYSNRNFTADLPKLVPQPKLKIWVQDPNSYQIPAAWEVAIAYPRKKIEILGVQLQSPDRSEAYATVGAPTGPEDSCTDKTGQTKISVIDPDRRSAWVEVVYRLRDFGTCGRAVPGDFVFVANSFKSYKADGTPISPPYAWIDDAYSFR